MTEKAVLPDCNLVTFDAKVTDLSSSQFQLKDLHSLIPSLGRVIVLALGTKFQHETSGKIL